MEGSGSLQIMTESDPGGDDNPDPGGSKTYNIGVQVVMLLFSVYRYQPDVVGTYVND
jgi:hypothetical protein